MLCLYFHFIWTDNAVNEFDTFAYNKRPPSKKNNRKIIILSAREKVVATRMLTKLFQYYYHFETSNRSIIKRNDLRMRREAANDIKKRISSMMMRKLNE